MTDHNEDPDGRLLKVTSSKNQCMGCKYYFNSFSAFEKHRTGSYTLHKRRCLSKEEMISKHGMQQNEEGYWTLKPDPEAIERLKKKVSK